MGKGENDGVQHFLLLQIASFCFQGETSAVSLEFNFSFGNVFNLDNSNTFSMLQG